MVKGVGRCGRRSASGGRPAVRAPPAQPAGSLSSAGALRGELGDAVGVLLGDEGRTGENGRGAAAADVAVVPVEPEGVDGEVALQVGLLVDGEFDRAVL